MSACTTSGAEKTFSQHDSKMPPLNRLKTEIRSAGRFSTLQPITSDMAGADNVNISIDDTRPVIRTHFRPNCVPEIDIAERPVEFLPKVRSGAGKWVALIAESRRRWKDLFGPAGMTGDAA